MTLAGMELLFECKRCDTPREVELATLGEAALRCAGCGQEVPAETLAALRAAIAGLSDALAALRGAGMRLEVLLETDDLPAPHGFDADYTLPEMRDRGE